MATRSKPKLKLKRRPLKTIPPPPDPTAAQLAARSVVEYSDSALAAKIRDVWHKLERRLGKDGRHAP